MRLLNLHTFSASNLQDSLEDSPHGKSQLSEKSPLEPLDDEVEEAPLDREVPSKPAEPLPSEDLGIAQSEPSSELGMFCHEWSWMCSCSSFVTCSIPFEVNSVKSLEHMFFSETVDHSTCPSKHFRDCLVGEISTRTQNRSRIHVCNSRGIYLSDIWVNFKHCVCVCANIFFHPIECRIAQFA